MFSLYEKFSFNDERQFSFKQILRKIFLEDWLMKLIALVITLALWFGVSGLSTPVTTRLTEIPLTLRFSNNMDVTNSPVQEVNVVITGDKRRLAQINKSDLIVSVDLTEVQPGDRMIQLTPENVSVELPTGVKLEEIQPNKLAIKLEAVEEREIDVKPETEGSIADGFEIYSESVLPQKVRVRAPSSYIKSLNFISTEKINLENQSADFTAKQVPLIVSNPKATILDTAVDVVFRIGEKRVEKLVLVPVSGDDSNRRATVILYGRQSLLENVRPEDLQVEIVKNEAGGESLQLNMPAELQNNVEIRKLEIK